MIAYTETENRSALKTIQKDTHSSDRTLQKTMLTALHNYVS